tara:strand:- start:3076 stop:3267 length:192 start_codon:yes stop_codon:yes gene_type:complete
MLSKFELIALIIALLIIFYVVIFIGSGGSKNKSKSPQIKSYLFGVKILIIIIGIVALVLTLFL